jgi:hypothetical protein
MPNQFIVITSINPPTEAVQKFSQLQDWQVVLVADLKTPKDWQLEGVKVLTVEEQKALPLETAKLLPWNHYARKNLGYLYAMLQGAELLYETDDDNLPYDQWQDFFPAQSGAIARQVVNPTRFTNAYLYFCETHVWPRGFPLSEILNQSIDQSTQSITLSQTNAPVLQGLADLEPDVDAIFRLTVGQQIQFSRQEPLLVGPETYCPFNSQNTLWYPEAFQYLFLPGLIPSRVTDIWRGYIVQRFLHQKGQGVLFFSPSVYQERNYHNLLHDFAEELDLYTKTEQLVEALERYQGNYTGVIQYLARAGFFKTEEGSLFDAWMHDLKSLGIALT